VNESLNWLSGPRRLKTAAKKHVRHTPEQIIVKLREADAMLAGGAAGRPGAAGVGREPGDIPPLAEPVRRPPELKAGEANFRGRLKGLEQENARLKKLLAETHLDHDIRKSALDHLGNG
jgi:hypothetical protein